MAYYASHALRLRCLNPAASHALRLRRLDPAASAPGGGGGGGDRTPCPAK
jgi:hypothetical protein